MMQVIGQQCVEAWALVTLHLWQFTCFLVLCAGLVQCLGQWAPARIVNRIWWVAFAKLWLPSSALSGFGLVDLGHLPLADEAWLAPVSAVYSPALLRDVSLMPGLAMVGWVAWALGAVWIWRSVWAVTHVALVPSANPRLCRQLAAVLDRLDLASDRALLVEGKAAPSVQGVWRPRIVVPEPLIEALDDEELEAVLWHEEAHLARHDPLRSVLTAAAQTLFYFYPPVWWLTGRLQRSTEWACDERALEAGVAPSVCARALALTVCLRLIPTGAASFMGASPRSLVRERLDRLDQAERYFVMKKHRMGLVAASLLLGMSLVAPRLPLAEEGTADGTKQSQLVMPKIVYSVAPKYPEDARRAGVEGRVLLDVVVETDGTVGDVTPAVEVEDYPSFSKAAVRAVKQWRFAPATDGGDPIRLSVKLPIRFELDPTREHGGEAAPKTDER